MIKSTKTTLKFTNQGKLDLVKLFIDEYKKVIETFVDLMWNLEKVPVLAPKELTDKITDTWLSARAIQCAGKQASGIVRGTKKKHEQREWRIADFIEKGMFKKARKLQSIHEKKKLSKPSLNKINPELDSRFIKIDLENHTCFDGWVVLSSIGNKLKINLPFKKHKHFNKMEIFGKLLKGIRLSLDKITFMFECEKDQREEGTTVGIDIGQTTILSCSSGQQVTSEKHGHSFRSICEKLSRKKKGSKGFKKAEDHRDNFLNWSINQLNLKNVKTVRLENIKHIFHRRRMNRVMTHWNYSTLLERLEEKLSFLGVQVEKVSPTYTSQRCSSCGWTRKSNRKRKVV